MEMSEEYKNKALHWIDKSLEVRVGAEKDRCLLRALVYAVLDVGQAIDSASESQAIYTDTVYPEE